MGDFAASFGLPQGEAYQRLYAILPYWLGYTLAFLGAGCVAWRHFTRRPPALPRRLTARRVAHWSTVGCLAVGCTIVLLALDGPGFLHGFFRQDDFSFLQVVRENEDLMPQLRLFHNDHAYPLFRLEVWALVKLAGPATGSAKLAAYFNLLIFLSCAGLLLAGCWTLHESGCSPVGIFLYVPVLWLWPGWGEFTAGFFTLSAYLQVQALSFLAAAAMLRGFRTNSRGWLGFSLLSILVAVGIDTSGLSAFVTVGLLSFAALRYETRFRWLGYAVGIAASFLVVQWYFAAVFAHPYSPRELVQNPSGEAFRLALQDFARTHGLAAAAVILQGWGGLVAAYATPTFLQFFANKLTPAFTLAVALAQLLLLAVSAKWIWSMFRSLPLRDRLICSAFGANALAGIAMVLVARSYYAINVPIALWHAKYVAFPLCWLALAAAFLLDRLWLQSRGDRNRYIGGLAVGAIAGVWLALSNWQLERALLPTPLAYVARGRQGNVENAKTRARQHSSLMGELHALAHASPSTGVALPPPESWQRAFFSHYGALEWATETSPVGVTHLFWDLPAAAPVLALQGYWQPASQLDPKLRVMMTRLEWLRPAFASPDLAPPSAR